jgi:hypothetical protein
VCRVLWVSAIIATAFLKVLKIFINEDFFESLACLAFDFYPRPSLLWVNEKCRRNKQMPLANLNRQCSARARSTGNRCLNPAAFGCKTCRYHGARRRETVKVGKAHPNYRHGGRTKDAIEHYWRSMFLLNQLETFARKKGFIKGPRTSGRKQRRETHEAS